MDKREEIQKAAVESAIDNDFNLAMVISPRVGKCKIVIDAVASRFNANKVCIASPREDINRTWALEILKWSEPGDAASYASIICFPSLKKIEEDLDLLVVDEYHMLSVNQMRWIKQKRPKRIWLLTGTADKYTRSIVNYQLGKQVKFEYPMEQAILDGIVGNFHVYVIRTELDPDRRNVYVGPKDHKFWTTEKKAYDYYTELFEQFSAKEKADPTLGPVKDYYARMRAELLYKAERKIAMARNIASRIQDRVLVFTTRTSVADTLAPWSYHSKNKKEKNLQKFIEEEIGLLSVCQMSDMGITIPSLKNIVVHQLQSSPELSIQKFMRACNMEDEDKEAVIFVTVYKDTVDESWTKSALEGVPSDKVTWLEIGELGELMNKLR